ncbi:MAG: hypothetical protein LC121_16005 [Anaerolineae bacterium]|nr:hypothetical protein [Anaerolineae bacterium]
MAAVALTAPTPGTGAQTQWGTAGATIVAGQAVYLDSSTNTYKLADAGAATTDAMAGFALTGASSGQPVKVLTAGAMNATGLTAGEAYFLNTTAGSIGLYADLTGGTDYITYVGTASTTTAMVVDIHVSSVQLHA